jgi:hypothetical protein
MVLEAEGQKKISNPNRDQITESINRLNNDSSTFAIISKAKRDFIQTCYSTAGGLLLEYLDGSNNKHFQSLRHNLTLQEVTEVFCSYNRGESNWKQKYKWKLLELDSEDEFLDNYSMVFIILTLILLVLGKFLIMDDGQVKYLHIDALTYLTCVFDIGAIGFLNDLTNFSKIDGLSKARAISMVGLAIFCTIINFLKLIID